MFGFLWSIFYADFYIGIYIGLKNYVIYLPRNINDIKRNPRGAVHLQSLTNGLFAIGAHYDCLMTMLQCFLTCHRGAIKDQRVHISDA